MAKKIINLGARYKSAFGYVAGRSGSSLERIGFNDRISQDVGNVYVATDGSFEEMTLRGNGFELLFANAMANNSTAGKIFAPPPMVTYSRTKTITTTPIDDSDEDPTNDAVVVERYNSGQWEIKLQGLLIDMVNHSFPKDQLIVLRQIFDVNNIFAVEGDWWDALNIKSIYIENFSPAGVQGYEDTIQFSLSAFSIKPVEFFLKNQ